MSYPQQTFPTFADLLAYQNTNWVTNGNGDIDAIIGNNVVNGLLTFIEQSPINYAKAQIISAGGIVTSSRPITIFMTTAPTELSWVDNIYNQYVFINTTSSSIPLASGFFYYNINLAPQSSIPAKTILSIAKASNNNWVSIYNASSGSATSYAQIQATVDINDTSYQSNDLIGATDVGFLIADNQIFTLLAGDYSFDDTTGEVTFINFSCTKLVIPFNKAN